MLGKINAVKCRVNTKLKQVQTFNCGATMLCGKSTSYQKKTRKNASTEHFTIIAKEKKKMKFNELLCVLFV